MRLALQAAAVACWSRSSGIFAHSLLQGSTTVSAELNDGKTPAAPNFACPSLTAAATSS